MALYGNAKIPRDYCSRCRTFSFVLDGVRQCCDSSVEIVPIFKTKRMSVSEGKRRKPKKAIRDRILMEQDNSCLYCDRSFGSSVMTAKGLRKIYTHWDHGVPFKYLQGNPDNNWVAACMICNAFKSSFVFRTVEEVKIYVSGKWDKLLQRKKK